MVASSYVFDPADPRAPSQEVWDALTDEARREIVANLPSEIPRAGPPEGDPHSWPKARAREALGQWFRSKGRSVYLGSELPVYYPDEPMFAPDLIAVLDVETHHRMAWVVSDEGKGLDFVLEIHVSGDRHKDAVVNVERLARLGVPEYFFYEPLRRRIAGHRLPRSGATSYEPIIPQGGRWSSLVLDLDLAIDQDGLRFFAGPAPLPDARELIEQLSAMVDGAVERAEGEAARAQEEAARAHEEAARAQEEAARAQEEAARAQEEAARADRLAAKLRELGVDPESLE
ncbi:MAG TPA: Uma2 family endonuclease [Polyangiaceae bacterium]|nr:Uma2 family endonuclease [Polyangiaceae bacterium]